MSTKTIGVCLAMYNGEAFIQEQLLSILFQTKKPSQIIISDGGSTDDSVAICKRIIENNKYDIEILLLESTEKLNINSNFQKALNNCHTDYIFLSDQDDVWISNKIECFFKYIEIYSPSLLFSNAKIVDENLKPKNLLWDSIGFRSGLKTNQVSVLDRDKFLYQLIRRNYVTGMCCCLEKTFASSILPFPKYLLYDSWVALNSSFFGDIIAINKPLVFYRQHSNNVVGTSSSFAEKLKKKHLYPINLKNRILSIQLFMNQEFVKNTINEVLKLNYDEYFKFLEERYLLITQKKKTVSLKILFKYFQYVSHPFQILLKDLYILVSNKG